jgi:signal transduction histidine kinase
MLTNRTVTDFFDPAEPDREAVVGIARLRDLLKISRALVGTVDSEALFDLVVGETTRLVGASACLLLIAGGGERAIVAASSGVDGDRARDFSAPLDEHIDAAIAGLFGCSPDAMIAVPVVAHGLVDGVLAASWSDPEKPRLDDEFLLSAMADQAAIALGQAVGYLRLYRSEREARETAESAVRMRDELLAMVSHDLRNPLSTIAMSALLLLSELPPDAGAGTTSPVRKQAERIQRSVDQMLRLVDDLLDVARLEAGTFAIERARHPAATLAREALDICHLAAQEKSIALDLVLRATDVVVECDRARVLQVLANLIGNAVKFTPRGGSVQLSVEKRDGELVFCVSDTGPGIPPEQLGMVFDRYWQADRRSRQGSGLGLFIARSLVQAHGGRIWADSVVGVGSAFSFALPDPT